MELPRNLPSREDLAAALGLQPASRSSMDPVAAATLFGVGVLVGAGLALLFAPTSGRELREEIGEKAGQLRDTVSSHGSQGSAASG